MINLRKEFKIFNEPIEYGSYDDGFYFKSCSYGIAMYCARDCNKYWESRQEFIDWIIDIQIKSGRFNKPNGD